MQIKNTDKIYGLIAKWFHWVTAVLFLISYCAIYYRHWFADSDLEKWRTIQLHFSVGITIVVVVTLRLLWRCLNPVPKIVTQNRYQHFLVRLGHYVLYAMMFIMPISGYLSIGDYLSSGRGTISYFLLFDLTSFQDVQVFNLIGITLKELEKPADLIHSNLGEWAVWLLIVGHILAALYHHFVKKDRTLYKITFHHH